MTSLSKLVVRVKSIKINKTNSLQQIIELIDLIYMEWGKIKKTYRKKIPRNALRLFLDYEAEEEIIIGLISHLNEKLINSCKNIKL
jgi:hypothetical protein